MVTPNEIRAAVEHLRGMLEEVADMALDQVRDSSHLGRDLDWAKHCLEKAQLIAKHERALQLVEDDTVDVLFNTLSFSSDDVEVGAGGLRTIIVEVSQGMLNQHLLTLTDARRQGVVQLGEQFKIQLADGTEFTTEICDPGNKLRERGLIRRFYDDAKIKDGDKVVLKEISARVWRLLSATEGEGADLMNARAERDRRRIEELLGPSEKKTAETISNNTP